MVLGAAPQNINGMGARELAWILGAGLVTGLPAGLLRARFTRSRLFGVQAFDATVVVVAVTVSLAAAAAGYLPARRASRVSPLHALRYE